MSDVLNRARPDAVIAHGPQGAITHARFRADVHRLMAAMQERFPASRHLLNICTDRYRFMVGFVASLASDRISLLPSSHTPETVRQLRNIAADVFCLCDDDGTDVALPRLTYPGDQTINAIADEPLPAIPADRIAAYVFTSGSTGTPVPHRKTWGALIRNAQAEAAQLKLDEVPHHIVATVPPQHMYGFESSVLLCLLCGCPFWSGRPFYPADIAAALAQVPRPRLLVTTPFHLRALLDAGIELPAVDRMLSATASLPHELAQRAERELDAPLDEIYGCTETGQIATRRVTVSPAWQPMAGIELHSEGNVTYASGGHVEGRIALSDVIECQSDGSFLLQGRQADLVNIAGKRTSLAYLNQQLLAIDGVEDGSFFMPEEDDGTKIVRLCAAVVAPRLTQRELLDALRQRIDAAFLPRPLIFVARLPRNATGKLTHANLAALVARHRVPAP